MTKEIENAYIHFWGYCIDVPPPELIVIHLSRIFLVIIVVYEKMNILLFFNVRNIACLVF